MPTERNLARARRAGGGDKPGETPADGGDLDSAAAFVSSRGAGMQAGGSGARTFYADKPREEDRPAPKRDDE
jgi:hypothetical protein